MTVSHMHCLLENTKNTTWTHLLKISANHGFVVTTMQQQTSFFIRNDIYVKLLYLKSKNEIGIYIRCNYQTTTDFFRHNK